MGDPTWVTDNMICAGMGIYYLMTVFSFETVGFRLTGAEDPERCMTLGYGDSGGPLVCRHPGIILLFHQ